MSTGLVLVGGVGVGDRGRGRGHVFRTLQVAVRPFETQCISTGVPSIASMSGALVDDHRIAPSFSAQGGSTHFFFCAIGRPELSGGGVYVFMMARAHAVYDK